MPLLIPVELIDGLLAHHREENAADSPHPSHPQRQRPVEHDAMLVTTAGVPPIEYDAGDSADLAVRLANCGYDIRGHQVDRFNIAECLHNHRGPLQRWAHATVHRPEAARQDA